jgi:hypothetical protein
MKVKLIMRIAIPKSIYAAVLVSTLNLITFMHYIPKSGAGFSYLLALAKSTGGWWIPVESSTS